MCARRCDWPLCIGNPQQVGDIRNDASVVKKGSPSKAKHLSACSNWNGVIKLKHDEGDASAGRALSQLVQGPMETREKSPTVWRICRDRFAACTCAWWAAGSGQIRFGRCRRCEKQLIDAVEELEVATDSEDVACAVFFFSRTSRNMF